MTASAPFRVIAFAAEGVFSPVLDSQVAMPLAMLGRVAPEIPRALLVLTSHRHRKHPQRAAREDAIRRALPDVPVHFRFRPIGGVPFERSIWAHLLRESLRAADFVGAAPIIVHCRGASTAAAAALLRRRDARLRVLTDMRGDPLDEVSRRGLWSLYLHRAHLRRMRQGLSGADGLNTVSRRLAEHLDSLGLLRSDLPRSVVGCCVDPERFHFDPARRAARRRELGLDGKFVVGYCGSMVRHQRPDAIAAAFAAIHAGMPDAHFLAITREHERLLEHFRQVGLGPELATARAAAHDEVASYLMAADAGLLLREDIMTNRVASPVKFAEYLRCGVPVILTPYIGDLGDLAVRENVGRTVTFPPRPDEVLAAAREIRAQHETQGNDGYRRHCSAVAGDKLSWGGQIHELLRLYRTLAGA